MEKTYGTQSPNRISQLKSEVCFVKSLRHDAELDGFKFQAVKDHPMLLQFSQAWPVDDLAGQYLENHSGYSKKQVRPVIHNSYFSWYSCVLSQAARVSRRSTTAGANTRMKRPREACPTTPGFHLHISADTHGCYQ